tara:strand:+ start:7602 stop:9926 length:2325 start_codon:yes stop_codon:yes gene_type:complete
MRTSSKLFFIIQLFFLFINSIHSQNATIRGTVYEKETGEPSFGTNVKIKGTGTGASSDINGFYQINKLKEGKVILEISNIEFKSQEFEIELKNGKIITQNFYMEINDEVLDEFEYSAEAEERKTEVKMSVISATPKDMAHVVAIGGEPDFAQYLQTTPGVVTTGDQGGQMYIRGGSPIQNKVLLDGMTIYNPFHSIGFFSVFDTDIIRSADIYTGGFSAEYGGRISSIMDITTIDGNKKHHSGKIAVNPFGSKLKIEGPIKKLNENNNSGSASYIFSGKTSYLEQSSKQLYTYIDSNGLPFNFTDLYGKISINGNTGSKFNLFGFSYNDQVKYKAVSDFNWDSWGIGSNFVVIPASSPVLIMGRFNISDYKISLSELDPVNFGDTLDPRTSRINGFNLGFDFKYFIGENEVKYGLEVNGFATKFNFTTLDKISNVIEDYTTELSAYIDGKIIKGLLVINPSFRAQYYASLKELSPEPRIGMKYNLSENIRLKAAGGLYSQNLIATNSDRDVVNLFYSFLQSGKDTKYQDEIILDNGDTINRKHKLQKATHAIFGGEVDLAKHLTLNIEGYYKWFNQLTNINRNKLYKEDNDFNIETGDAYGVDLVLKYSNEKTYLWGVYSIGKVTRWDGERTYSPLFDRRHNINIVATQTFGDNNDWEINLRWNYGSGLPFTQTQGYYHSIDYSQGINTNITSSNSNQLELIYGDLNQGRLSSYHRLDLAIKRNLEINKSSNLDITASVTNIYSRKNIFYVDRITNEKVFQLPILPSLGLSWKF